MPLQITRSNNMFSQCFCFMCAAVFLLFNNAKSQYLESESILIKGGWYIDLTQMKKEKNRGILIQDGLIVSLNYEDQKYGCIVSGVYDQQTPRVRSGTCVY